MNRQPFGPDLSKGVSNACFRQFGSGLGVKYAPSPAKMGLDSYGISSTTVVIPGTTQVYRDA